ncbi:MAG: DNA cytosine methyltransferase [Candidatus Nanohaloarchaea archaeon]
MTAPTVISTFAGCGGSSLGYEHAGFEELLAIDWNDTATDTLSENFDTEVWNRDISTVTGEEIKEATGLEEGELDVLDGSPPCQGFSLSGKREVDDDRNDLFKEYVRIADELQPKVLVMENVTGLVQGEMKGRFKEIMTELKGLGYQVRCKKLNAKYYGVPQSRERLFWIGVREDIDAEPVFPEPDGTVPTVKAALKGVPKASEIRRPKARARKLARRMGQCERGRDYHPNGSYFNLARVKWSAPCRTVTKTFSPGCAGLLHPEEDRYLTIPELKRICSFPDDFELSGSFTERWNQLGNAVMPKQMEAIAETLKEEVLEAGNNG